MNAVLYGLIGATVLAALLLLYWSAKTAWQAFQVLIHAIADLGRQMKLSMQASNALVTSNKKVMETFAGAAEANKKALEAHLRLIEVANKVGTELEMLRSVFMAPQVAADGTPATPGAPGTGPLRKGLHPFPAPLMENFTPIPDTHEASVEETDIEETEDATMADLEKLEYQRQQGFEVEEEPEVQPGVVAESN